MSSERESNEIKKSMAYDLFQILESGEDPEKRTYSMQDIKDMINNYIRASTSNS